MAKPTRKPTVRSATGSPPKAAPVKKEILLPAFFQNEALQKLLFFALAVLLYANTLTHGFVQDDAIVITDNMFTTQGIQGIPGILSKDTFLAFSK